MLNDCSTSMFYYRGLHNSMKELPLSPHWMDFSPHRSLDGDCAEPCPYTLAKWEIGAPSYKEENKPISKIDMQDLSVCFKRQHNFKWW